MIIQPNNSNVANTTSQTRTRGQGEANNIGERTKADQPEKGRGSQDSVSLSDTAKALGQLEAQIAATPDVDEAKVEAVKTALAEGRYRVDSQTIADRLLAQDDLLG